jgi:hypothetical protein
LIFAPAGKHLYLDFADFALVVALFVCHPRRGSAFAVACFAVAFLPLFVRRHPDPELAKGKDPDTIRPSHAARTFPPKARMPV